MRSPFVDWLPVYPDVAKTRPPSLSRRCAPFTRVYAVFEDYAGTFVWHCHIIEHEDMV